MNTRKSIHCSVITPEEQVLETEAVSVVLPAHDGYVGLLLDRSPLLCEMGTGILRINDDKGAEHELYVDGGFAQVLQNDVTILTERAALGEDIIRADAEKELADAEALEAHTEEEVAKRLRAIARAKAQLRIARGRKQPTG